MPSTFKSQALLYVFSIALLLTGVIYSKLSQPKIAYVKTLEIVYGFNGMKQAHLEYRSQEETWKANIDTLKWQHQQAVTKYRSELSKFTPAEKKNQETLIRDIENNIKEYSSVVEHESQEKEKKVTEAVLNQINTFIDEYAKKNGYDFVLGADGSGSVIYGEPKYDITKDVLEKLNSEYKMLPDAK